MAPTVATWAIDSTRMTPGTIGLPGKCPAWYHSLPVKVCSPTARPQRCTRVQLLLVVREAILCCRAGSDDLDVTHTGLGVDRRVRGAREVARANERDRDDAAAACGDADRRINDVLAGHAVCALERDFRGDRAGRDIRLNDVPGNSGLVVRGVRVEADSGIERAPDLAVGERDLLHTRVVGVKLRDDFWPAGVGSCTNKEAPTAGPHDRRGRFVVEAVTLRTVGGRGTSRSWLVGLAGERVLAHAEDGVRERE